MQIKQNNIVFQGIFNNCTVAANSLMLYTIIFLAIASFLCSLGLPSVGEEGVYSNITLEMLNSQNYFVPTLYGVHYSRPPLFNWLMIPITHLLGVANVVIAARLVNIGATLLTALLLYKFVARKFIDRSFALFSCAAFLSGDLLFKRGWLAYADSLFALCVFAAILSLWLALDRQQARWLITAAISLSCAFLAKVHTAYIFYGIAGLVLLWKHPQRKFLFSGASWLIHAAAISFPICWTLYVNRGYGGVSTTWLQSQSFLEWPGFLAYVTRVIALYPLDVASRFLPVSLIAIWALWKNKSTFINKDADNIIAICFWITLLNLLPYWLAPYSNIRYILPLYPFIALLFAYPIWQSKAAIRNLAVSCLMAVVILKYVYAIAWLPYEHSIWRGNAYNVASAIQHEVGDAPLYTNDSTSSGLRVTVELNKLRFPAAPLTVPPSHFTGYAIADNDDPSYGTLIKTYSLRNNKLYLFFKGSTG